jgi:hypothetical protein
MERSEQVGDLVSALAKAQSEFKPAVKDSSNPYYNAKYADLATIIEATRAALTKNGIAVMHSCASDIDRQVASVSTFLYHGDQWIGSTAEAPAVGKAKDGGIRFDAQTIGAAWTYLRRYQLQALIGLASEDDDGNALVTDKAPPPAVKRGTPTPTPAPQDDGFKQAFEWWSKTLKECVNYPDLEVKVVSLWRDAKNGKENAEEFLKVADKPMLEDLWRCLPNLEVFNTVVAPLTRLALHVRKPFITEASDEAKRRGYIVNRTSGFYEEGKK